MRKISVGFLAFFVLLGAFRRGADAAEWTLFVQDQGFKHFYDRQSIFHPTKEIIRVAIKVDPKGKEGRDFLLNVRKEIGLTLEGYENYAFSVTIMEIDCENHVKRILQSDDYNQKGELLDAVSSPNQKWAPIAPESVHGLYEKVLCKK